MLGALFIFIRKYIMNHLLGPGATGCENGKEFILWLSAHTMPFIFEFISLTEYWIYLCWRIDNFKLNIIWTKEAQKKKKRKKRSKTKQAPSIQSIEWIKTAYYNRTQNTNFFQFNEIYFTHRSRTPYLSRISHSYPFCVYVYRIFVAFCMNYWQFTENQQLGHQKSDSV